MRLLILADMDDFHWTHGGGQAEAVVACGDVADPVILEAAQAYGCATILAVKGNHDRPAGFTGPIADLHLRVVECGGLRFAGLNGSWRYKPRGHFLYEQEEVGHLLRAFPAVDVFVSHNSPRGIHDREDDVHIGFDGLTAYIARAAPRLLVHGHQHVNRETQAGQTRVVAIYGHRLIDI